MELRPGYKKTEVGVIPEDWEVKELGEICFPSKSRINPITSNKNYKCIELEHLSQGSGVLLGTANSKDLLSQKSIFEKGDILFGKLRPYLRKFLFADFDGVCTTEIWVLKTKKDMSNRFLYQLVQSEKIIEAANLSTGTKMPRAEWKTVSETKIPLPTVPEQAAIATALSDADALITSLEKLIDKKRNIKQGAMQKLLQPNEGWEVKKLGDLCLSISSGKSNTQSVNGEYPIYGSTGIIGWKNYADYEGNKILVARVGANAGTVNKVKGQYCVSDNTLIITLIPKIDIDFIFFKLIAFQLGSLVFGSGQPLITSGHLKNIEIVLPKFEEQNRIATILADMDAEISALETKLEKYRKIKQGMMQNLLTGKIRLV